MECNAVSGYAVANPTYATYVVGVLSAKKEKNRTMLQITRNDESELHLRRGVERGRLSFGIAWTLISLLAGLGFSYEVGTTTLAFFRNDHASVDCLVTNTYYLGISRSTRSVDDIVGAKLVRAQAPGTNSDCGTLIDYAVAAVMPGGALQPLLEGRSYQNCVSGDETKMEEIADRINRFIKSGEPVKMVVYDQRFGFEGSMFPFVGAAIFLIFGISRIIRYARVRTLILRKDKYLLWRNRSFFNAFLGRTRKYPIRAIKDVTIDTEIDNEGECWYTLVVRLSAKRRISFGESRRGDEVSEIARQLREFLGLPLETNLAACQVPPEIVEELAGKKPGKVRRT